MSPEADRLWRDRRAELEAAAQARLEEFVSSNAPRIRERLEAITPSSGPLRLVQAARLLEELNERYPPEPTTAQHNPAPRTRAEP